MNRKLGLTYAAGGLTLGVALGAFLAGNVLHGQPQSAFPQPQPQPPAVLAAPIPGELTSYRDIVKRVLPSVVSVDAKARQQPRRPRDERKNEPAELGFGSGVLIAANGVVLTNYHVIEGADFAEIALQDGRKFTTQDIRGDKKSDLAIVRLAGTNNLPFLPLGDSDRMEIGDRVLAVGAPFGLTGSVTHGIISAKSRDLKLNFYDDFLQTDAAINPGNSGGPLVNLSGEVIGINSAIKSRSGGFQGVGLAISSNLARSVVQSLQKDGAVRRAYLGVKMGDDLPTGGVTVDTVFARSAAETGGMQAGDVIVNIGGRAVKDGREMQRVVAGLPLGQVVEVQVLRGGKAVKLSLTPQAQPEELGRP